MTSTRRPFRLAAVLVVAFTLTGCSATRMDTDLMREIAEARDTCAELGGRFEQWVNELGAGWRCNFDEREAV